VIDPFLHEFHVVHSFDAQLLVASHYPNRTNHFFPLAVPAGQPMADIYVRLRDLLAVPRLGRQKLAPPGVNRLVCEQPAKTVSQLCKTGCPLFARALRRRIGLMISVQFGKHVGFRHA